MGSGFVDDIWQEFVPTGIIKEETCQHQHYSNQARKCMFPSSPGSKRVPALKDDVNKRWL